MTAFNTQVCKTADESYLSDTGQAFKVAINALLHGSPGMIKGELHKTSNFQFQQLICPALALLAL